MHNIVGAKNIQNRLIKKILYLITFFMTAGYICYYIFISAGQVPLMDYWLNSKEYLEMVMTQSFQWNRIFIFPHALHWNPLYTICDYFLIHIFRCDNRAYVYGGMMFSYAIFTLMLMIYRKHFEPDNLIATFIGIVLFVMPFINLNQWEIFTLYCNLQFMMRIFTYLVLMYFLDRLLYNYGRYRKGMLFICVFSIANLFTIFMMSQAYFPGLIAAEIAVILIDMIIYRKKEKKYIYIGTLLSSVIGFLFYYATLQKIEIGIRKDIGFFDRMMNYSKGLIIMLGGVLVPQTVAQENIRINYIMGSIILVLAIMAVFMFFKMKIYNETYFPLLCMIYAFVSIIVIMLGRMSYGLEYLTSSRYVVETTVGLSGLIQIYWWCFLKKRKVNRVVHSVVLFSMLIAIGYVNKTEMKIGPYRKAYNQNMVDLALGIDNVSDEELQIFQAPPEDVRGGIEVMKKYHLCLWRD
jgi:hypothetical protein